ncbi:hypothetical protein M3T53_00755 [Actinomyces sp. B33]|uniref:hypothetical protein n=1 Tax=Actinomyces sp. B33 TaxID=2942131 RepID=UPI002340445C|nr:hypothetical protein [Actinomyces sp. B33]MDC4232247.1 hypothetical protein [Actinomyces sp. B33]
MRRRLSAAIAAAALALIVVSPNAEGAARVGSSTAVPILSSVEGRHFYAYAPSVIREGDKEWVWTCQNSQDGRIVDDIRLDLLDSGSLSRSARALTASEDGWDRFHICDPSVVRVDATWQGVSYRYAMFYLGNDRDASAHNQVGIAYANDMSGPWVKNPTPVVSFDPTKAPSRWGVGQPSATTIDPESGTVLLFWVENYTGPHRDTRVYRMPLDLNEESGVIAGVPLEVTTAGLRGEDGAQDWLNNADFSYDPPSDRFYVVRERHPYPSGIPDWVGAGVELVSIDGASIWSGGGAWRQEAVIGPAQTGYPRNHNAGIVRTEYGTLPSPERIEILFTASCADCEDWLWSYRLRRVPVEFR